MALNTTISASLALGTGLRAGLLPQADGESVLVFYKKGRNNRYAEEARYVSKDHGSPCACWRFLEPVADSDLKKIVRLEQEEIAAIDQGKRTVCTIPIPQEKKKKK